jgi:uncharacterized Fe-S cluster-containing protein
MRSYTISRYEPMLSEDPYQTQVYATMEEDKSGEYVKQEDYELLEKRIAELEKKEKILYIEGQLEGVESVEIFIDGYYASCIVAKLVALRDQIETLKEKEL